MVLVLVVYTGCMRIREAVDLFLFFDNKKKKKKNHLVQFFEKKKIFFVILCFFLKSSMDSFLEYILDSISLFKVVDFKYLGLQRLAGFSCVNNGTCNCVYHFNSLTMPVI